MKYIYLFVMCSLLASCKEEKSCLSYDEAVAQGVIDKKTSSIKINDTLSYTLKFVMDKENGKHGYYCTGLLELQQYDFNKAAGFLKDYDYTKIAQLIVFFEDTDLCKGEIPAMKDVKAYMVYYVDKDNYLTTDYYAPHKKTETYRVSDIWGGVVVNQLFESGIKNLPSVIVVDNMSFDISKTKMIKKNQDQLFKNSHPDKIIL